MSENPMRRENRRILKQEARTGQRHMEIIRRGRTVDLRSTNPASAAEDGIIVYSPNETTRSLHTRGKILAVGGGIIAALILVEGGMRVWRYYSEPRLIAHDVVSHTSEPNSDGFFVSEGRRWHKKTNSMGFTGGEWREEKTGFRVAHLGDSFTEGRAVDFDKNFSSLLPGILAQRGLRDVEVLNFGVSGFGTAETGPVYTHIAKRFDPDLVVLWFYVGNDFIDNLRFSRRNREDGHASGNAGTSGLALLTVAHTVTQAIPEDISLLFTPRDPNNSEALAQTEKYLKDLHTAVLNDGKQLIVGILPAPLQVDPKIRQQLLAEYPTLADMAFDHLRPTKELVRILDSLRIPYADVTPDFETSCREACALYNCASCHFSPEGHIRAAAVMADFLIQRGFISQR